MMDQQGLIGYSSIEKNNKKNSYILIVFLLVRFWMLELPMLSLCLHGLLPPLPPSFCTHILSSANPSLRLPTSLLFFLTFSSFLKSPRHPPLPLPPLSLALHLLLSPCVLPVAHDPAVQPQADCGAHTAGEAAVGGALAQRTGASSFSSPLYVLSFPLIRASICLLCLFTYYVLF